MTNLFTATFASYLGLFSQLTQARQATRAGKSYFTETLTMGLPRPEVLCSHTRPDFLSLIATLNVLGSALRSYRSSSILEKAILYLAWTCGEYAAIRFSQLVTSSRKKGFGVSVGSKYCFGCLGGIWRGRTCCVVAVHTSAAAFSLVANSLVASETMDYLGSSGSVWASFFTSSGSVTTF